MGHESKTQLQITEPRRVVEDPSNTTDWTNRRTYFWDGKQLFVYEVRKGEYRAPPTGFSLSWRTNKGNNEVAAAALDCYLDMRRKFVVPQDDQSLAFINSTRTDALSKARQLKDRGLMRANLEAMEGHPERWEPLHVALSLDPELEEERNLYFYQDKPKSGLEAVKTQLLPRFRAPAFVVARLQSPFAVITFESGERGEERGISFESRFKFMEEPLALFQKTSVVTLDEHDISDINERLRKPLFKLPRLPEAA